MANRFGPAGNSESFYAQGHTSTKEQPAWLHAMGLDAFEYSFGRGVRIREQDVYKRQVQRMPEIFGRMKRTQSACMQMPKVQARDQPFVQFAKCNGLNQIADLVDFAHALRAKGDRAKPLCIQFTHCTAEQRFDALDGVHPLALSLNTGMEDHPLGAHPLRSLRPVSYTHLCSTLPMAISSWWARLP